VSVDELIDWLRDNAEDTATVYVRVRSDPLVMLDEDRLAVDTDGDVVIEL